MSEASFSRQVVAGVTVIDIAGEIDLANVGEFESALQDASEAHASTIVVSFEHATYIDSTTVNALLEQANSLRQKGCRLVLAAPFNGRCERIFRLVGIDKLLPVKDSIAEAVAS